MFEDLTKAVAELKKSKSIIFYSTEIDSVDKATSMIALCKICSKKGKSFQVLCPTKLRTPIENMFSREGVQVVNKPISKDYVVSVDYSQSEIDKVICKRDEDGKKLNFVITPKDKTFNFDNVELISGGSAFDLVFSFDLESLESLDEETKKIFEDANVISIADKEVEFANYKFLINEKKSYSELSYEFAKAFSDCISEEILNILLQGIVSKYKLLENGNNEGWLVVAQLLKYGADLNKALRSLYYSKDIENLQLQKKVMENIRMDKENKVVWSKVSQIVDVDSSNFDNKGRIVFNISDEFDIAFVIYYLDKETVEVVFESNNTEKYSASLLAEEFSAKGTHSRAVFKNLGVPAEDFERKLFEKIHTLFGIKILQ